MEDLSEWRDPKYLKRKRQQTAVEDPREIFPQCIRAVSKMQMMQSFPMQEVRRRFPNLEGEVYTEYIPSIGNLQVITHDMATAQDVPYLLVYFP